MRVHRAVLRPSPNAQWAASWIIAHTYPDLPQWVFGLLDEAVSQFRSIVQPSKVIPDEVKDKCGIFSDVWRFVGAVLAVCRMVLRFGAGESAATVESREELRK